MALNDNDGDSDGNADDVDVRLDSTVVDASNGDNDDASMNRLNTVIHASRIIDPNNNRESLPLLTVSPMDPSHMTRHDQSINET